MRANGTLLRNDFILERTYITITCKSFLFKALIKLQCLLHVGHESGDGGAVDLAGMREERATTKDVHFKAPISWRGSPSCARGAPGSLLRSGGM